jgi:hypothetical protein
MSKISTVEPAERPYTVALSAAEVRVLANHHVKICKKIPAKVGETAMNQAFKNPLMASHKSKALFNAARELMKAHSDRAIGLNSLLK